MPTIRGPIKVLSGGVATKAFVDIVTEKANADKMKFTMPFKAEGWKSAKNAELVTGKFEEKLKPVVPDMAEIKREIPEAAKEIIPEEATPVAPIYGASGLIDELTVSELEPIKGISKKAAIKLVETYKTKSALIKAIKASNVPELDKIRLGILRKAMGV